jgi:hypothetical protein
LAIRRGGIATERSPDFLRIVNAFGSVSMSETVDESEAPRKDFVAHKGHYLSLSAAVPHRSECAVKKLIDLSLDSCQSRK